MDTITSRKLTCLNLATFFNRKDNTQNWKLNVSDYASYQWKQLTKIIQPILPQPEQWQVVCYQHGVLTITGENQAMISQLSYLQSNYVAQLAQLERLKTYEKSKFA